MQAPDDIAAVASHGTSLTGQHRGRSRDRMPKYSTPQKTGNRSKAFVDNTVSDTDHVWNVT
ncbi:hypothetical protein GCM10023405_18120 [Streptomonospora salina]